MYTTGDVFVAFLFCCRVWGSQVWRLMAYSCRLSSGSRCSELRLQIAILFTQPESPENPYINRGIDN